MPNELKMKQSSAVLMAALAAAFPLTGQAAGAARVDFALGDVRALAPDGRSRALAKGAEVASGETIDTGNGRAQVRFSDGAQVSLQPQTQFRIDNYQFSGKADGSEKGFFSLIKGGLRTITGLVGRSNRDNYKVTTTVATIGIRGTEYSVTYGNSISVSTGEGIVEVCNAAGCLIVNSGETARVENNDTRPVLTDKKAELPPPPAQEGQLPGFTAGNDTSGSGAPAGLIPVLPSGPGYALALAGEFKDEFESGPMIGIFNHYSTSKATFDSSGALTNYDGGQGYSATAGTVVGALSDGTLGWGRWGSGTIYDTGVADEEMHNVHYVIGMPTPDADMSALQLGGMAGTYSLIGYTYPTAYNASTGVTTVGTQPITGSLTAEFGLGTVSGNLSVPMDAHVYTSAWSAAMGSGPYTVPAFFFGGGTVSGGACSTAGCSSSIAGFFAGAMASHAGLTYQFMGTDYGDISGAAAFRQTSIVTSTTLPPPPTPITVTGYTLAGIGQIGGVSDRGLFPGDAMSTSATFLDGKQQSFYAFDGAQSYTFTQGTPVGMLTDGILGWGRWIDGTFLDGGGLVPMQHVHYVGGMPTPTADMSNLASTFQIGTYSLTGFTYPTAWDGATTTFGTQPVTGSITANFGSYLIDGSLTVPLGANTYTAIWSGTIGSNGGWPVSVSSPSSFSGTTYATSTGADCGACGCYTNVQGFFSGANAARAGLIYDIGGTQYGSIHGAAAFTKN